MNEPDHWVILEIKTDEETFYKVFAGWDSSYLNGASWKINSGIIKVELDGNYYLFHGNSGSIYKCHKKCYGLNCYMQSVIKPFIQNLKVLENRDFTNLI